MKVLLINPPVPHTFYNREFYLPSGLLYLGAVLQDNGEEVQLIDFKIMQKKSLETTSSDPPKENYDNKLVRKTSEFNPNLIGFGGLISGNFRDTLRFSKIIKEKFPEIPMIMGGSHASLYSTKILENCPSLDWIVLGEGEDTLIQLVDMIKEGKYDLDKMDGFGFRKNGEIKINSKKRFIENTDTIPFPAYNLITLEDYYEDTSDWHNPKGIRIGTEVPIISSRSCPNDCNFCAAKKIMGRGWRPRSPTNVVDEIEYVYETYNHRHFSFMDDNLTLDKSRIIDICDEINMRSLDIQFETHNGVSMRTLDDEIIDAMASAGLTRIALPIESGSNYIRNKVMGKGLTKKKIFEVVDRLRKHEQVSTRAFFIIGMPEETHETLRDTYEIIKKIDVDRVHLTNIVPFPGTRVYAQALRDGLLVDLDPETMYLSDELYQTNYDRYFIKPYELELKDLHKFREKCDELIQELKKRK